MDKYRRKIKIKIMALIIITIVSFILIAGAYIFKAKITNSETEYFDGFIMGFIGALVLGVFVILFRFSKMLKNEDALKKFFIKKEDERNVQINMKAQRLTFGIIYYVLAFTSFIAMILGYEHYSMLAAYSLMGICTIYLIARIILQKII